jgi:hypothetical protein
MNAMESLMFVNHVLVRYGIVISSLWSKGSAHPASICENQRETSINLDTPSVANLWYKKPSTACIPFSVVRSTKSKAPTDLGHRPLLKETLLVIAHFS